MAEFKTLVIRTLTEMVDYGHKIEEKLKAMQSELKIYRELPWLVWLSGLHASLGTKGSLV